MQTREDSELLQALQNNEETAFKVLYDRYKRELYHYALPIVRDRQTVQDMIHEIFLRLWERRMKLRVHTKFRAYLFQAMRYKVIDHIERNKYVETYVRHFYLFARRYSEHADYQVRERMLEGIIEKEIQEMPPKMQRVFRMSRQEELSHAEIARILNISEQSVRSHIKNALRRLRSKLTMWHFLIWSILFL